MWKGNLSFIYGFRIFDPFLSDTVGYHTIGIMPSFGLNYYFPKKNLGLEVRRDLWIQLTGGNPNGYSLNNYYEVNDLNVFYDGLKKIPLRLSIGHAWTRIDNFDESLTETYHHVYRNKGISFTASYHFWKTRADFRTIIYYNQHQAIHGTSFSLGLTFYFNPLKKKNEDGISLEER